jgi:hypothetical protein
MSQAKSGVVIPAPRRRLWGAILWDEIKAETSPEVFVTIQFLAELVFQSVRDEIVSQPSETKAEIANYRLGETKDENKESGPSP